MSIGFILAAAAVAQAADAPAYGPEAPAPPRTAASAPAPRKDCSPDTPDPNSDTIVVCVVKPDGYRIDPDVLSARKAKRHADQGRPLNRSEKLADNSCAVGPHACIDTGVNLLAVALTAAQMADRLSKGQEIGSMFRTDPQMSEYEYYQLAKAERERAEVEAGLRPYSTPAGVEPEGEGVRD
jgi:hypothetical protein